MPRANNPASRQRRNKVLKLASGYRGSRPSIQTAQQSVDHSGVYAYRDRKNRKRNPPVVDCPD